MKVRLNWNWSKVVQYPMTLERNKVKLSSMKGKPLVTNGTCPRLKYNVVQPPKLHNVNISFCYKVDDRDNVKC